MYHDHIQWFDGQHWMLFLITPQTVVFQRVINPPLLDVAVNDAASPHTGTTCAIWHDV
ncbi:hypothetical protein [Calycomorphotria hydatis]|uniref:hypothetical protein n=1 Tax=Calycomorphotria hydatis TaxID=2528027 RepID=UPI0018D2116C|nr:hypothetical protein [Calycomorphotria hydatis]